MERFAAIDVGTNSVLLLVAERRGDGSFESVAERAEITRLGRGVDHSGILGDDAMAATVAVIRSFAEDARGLGARAILCSATSAARDARNGQASRSANAGACAACRRSAPTSSPPGP
jgi:exopolyphosphatase/guanosine-5'-triphosphate,3'-diphosphate pyrophosphatase